MGNYDLTGQGDKPKLGSKSFITPASPGPRNPSRATADSVGSANGKVARPGGQQKAPRVGAGQGSIARPGGNQKLSK